MRKVTVEMKFTIILAMDEGIEVAGAINELDYEFVPSTIGVDIVDERMDDYEIIDSK